MFISVWYDHNRSIVGAAPAYEKNGQAYEENGQAAKIRAEDPYLPAPNKANGFKKIHEVTDATVVEALLSLQHSPERLATVQKLWEQYLISSNTPTSPVSRFPIGRKPGSKIVMPKAA